LETKKGNMIVVYALPVLGCYWSQNLEWSEEAMVDELKEGCVVRWRDITGVWSPFCDERATRESVRWGSNKRERFDGRAETVIVSLDELRTMGEQRSWIYRNKEGEKNKKVKIPRGQFRRIILQSYTHQQMVLLLMVYETYTYEFRTVAKSLCWYMAIFL
jgi:hypothetical protein